MCAVFMVGCVPSTPADLATPSLQAVSLTSTPTAAPAPTATDTPEPSLPWRTDRIELSPTLDAMPDGVVVIQGNGSKDDISLLDLQTGGLQSFGCVSFELKSE
ncbi:MAG: hypothetical protein WA821_05000 [Anaerolineales bacterium]